MARATEDKSNGALDGEPDPLELLQARVEGDPVAQASYEDAARRTSLLAAMRALRERRQLSQTRVAKAMRTAQSSVSELEAGRIDPQLQTLQRYARAVGSRLDVAVVDDDLPVYEEGMANGLWRLVERDALSPLLTALVLQSDENERTLRNLADFVELPEPIVAPILSSLEQKKWVTARACPTRPDQMCYSLSKKAAYAAGVSLHSDKVVGVLADMQARVVSEAIRPLTNTRQTTVLAATRDVIEELYVDRRGHDLIGVGVNLAGVVSVHGPAKEIGMVRFAPDLQGDDQWQNVPLETSLQEAVQESLDRRLLVAVENDANSLVMREYLRDGSDALVVVLLTGSGIGAGVSLHGKIAHGASFAAGEIGHVIVDPSGPQCRTGANHSGCLETIASARSILLSLSLPCDNDADVEEGLAVASDRAARGDQGAIDAFKRAGLALGRALSSGLALIDPDRVVFYAHRPLVQSTDDLNGGGKRKAYMSADLFRAGVTDGLSFPSDDKAEHPRLEWRELGTTTTAVGAAVAATRHFLLDPAHWLPSVLADRTGTDGHWR